MDTGMDTDSDATGERRETATGDSQWCRLTKAALPAGLTHAPSRRFLVEEGLPVAAADLDFSELGTDGPEAGADGLFVLGETDYCGHVVLDGATGEVYLMEEAGHDARRDLLASSLPALAGLIRETEELSAAARRTEEHGGRRGPAVVAEARDAAERRMRAVDPRLFASDTPPAHWSTVLLMRSLSWGARPGGPGEPLHVFDTDLVEDLARLAGDGTVHRFDPDRLPCQLTHEPTRRLLVGMGLPSDGGLFSACEEPMRTMGEVYPKSFGSETGHEDEGGEDGPVDRRYQREFLALGWWPHDLTIALDGTTGRLELPDWYDDGEPHPYLHHDLSALLYACWTYERLREEWGRWEYRAAEETWQVFDPKQLLHRRVDEMVEAVDPEAFATSRHSWRMLAEDDYTGGLLA
ncbi:hypothetical protein GCM10018779_33590 [Streptomyces griseocarneus]|nr:hypothetical protein GCM10018779_33590 [Streptomyces griseocarneus]